MRKLITAAMIAGVTMTAYAQQMPQLTAEQAAAAAGDYQLYCALCHAPDREGHANDNAPSLRSKSLMEAGFYQRVMATSYGRSGTPMAGFNREIGGPMSSQEISRLNVWLQEQAAASQIRLPMATVSGDVEMGAELYASQCVECHGAKGEGITGTALGNPAMLSMTTDPFIRHAIVHGRQGTEMPAFGDALSDAEIDALTAFIRSRATGWEILKPVFKSPPPVEEYVINPDGDAPQWELKDGQYVLSADLYKAMEEGRRMVILDTRNMSLWQMSHIEGAVPVPYYYENVASLMQDLPRDGTWIITYCDCPRAAAEYVRRKLVDAGFEKTAVLWEGGFGWVGLGYPVARGEVAGVISN